MTTITRIFSTFNSSGGSYYGKGNEQKEQANIDSIYMLPNYRLLGVNYNKIIIINYFDQLTIQEEYSLSGCTDILPFSNHIIAISNYQLIRIDLPTQNYHVLGRNYTDLRYCKNKPFIFGC